MSHSAEFPTTFTEHPIYIEPTDVLPRHSVVFSELRSQGFVVVAGLQRSDVPALAEIASQAGTREYCPNDMAKRWATEEMTEAQLAKGGGRGVLRLESLEDGKTVGFGWTGSISEEEAALLPGSQITFAERLHEDMRGKRLGTPFAKAIVMASRALFNARNVGLETWASNTAAVKSYLGADAQLVTTVDSERPTLIEQSGTYDKNGVLHRRDVRLYMQYPWS